MPDLYCNLMSIEKLASIRYSTTFKSKSYIVYDTKNPNCIIFCNICDQYKNLYKLHTTLLDSKVNIQLLKNNYGISYKKLKHLVYVIRINEVQYTSMDLYDL